MAEVADVGHVTLSGQRLLENINCRCAARSARVLGVAELDALEVE